MFVMLQESQSTHRRMVKTLEGGRQKTAHKNHGAKVASFVCVSPPLKVSIVTMGFTAGLIGAATGFSVQMFSNATRKVPLSRAPWLHVTYSIIGALSANAYLRKEKQLVEDINAIRANKGMPPLVGSNAWIRYDYAEE
jgi:hypothetical protein